MAGGIRPQPYSANLVVFADRSIGVAASTDIPDRAAADSRYALASAVTSLLAAKADLVGGLVPANQLPSYVDDVIEAANFAALPGTGETGKIYVALDTGKTYRWSGSAYVEISTGLGGSLGATANRVLTTLGTGGSTAQSCPVSIDGSGNVTGAAALTASGNGSFGFQITATRAVLNNSVVLAAGSVSASLAVGFSNNADGVVHCRDVYLSPDGSLSSPVRIRNNGSGVVQFRNGTNSADVAIICSAGTFSSGKASVGASGLAFVETTSETSNVRLGFNGAARLSVNTQAIDILDTGIDRIRFGTTNAFPMIKRSGTTTQFRLGDDSADAPIACSTVTTSGVATIGSGVTENSTSIVLGFFGIHIAQAFDAGICFSRNSAMGQPMLWAVYRGNNIPCVMTQAGGMIGFASGNTYTSTVDVGWKREASDRIGVYSSNGSALCDYSVRHLLASGTVGLGAYTVATLPSAAANAGRIAQVTDSSVTANGSAVSGGGSNRVMVFSNGTTWDVVVA